MNLTELTRYRVIVDTSSLMFPKAEEFFMQSLMPKFKQYEAKLVIYSSVAGEIDKHTDSDKPYTRRVAQQAQRVVQNLTIEGTTELVMTEDTFADFVLVGELYRLRRYFNQGLITQDAALAEDALKVKKMRSSRYHTDIKVYRIADIGELVSWEDTASASVGTKHVSCPAIYQHLPVKNMMVVPRSCSNKAANIPILTVVQKKSAIKQRTHEEANKKKQKAEATAILQQRLVNTFVSGSKAPVVQQKPGSANLLERLLRTVSGTFRHQGPRIGGSR
jgi:rRNA-processing protein FCF1